MKPLKQSQRTSKGGSRDLRKDSGRLNCDTVEIYKNIKRTLKKIFAVTQISAKAAYLYFCENMQMMLLIIIIQQQQLLKQNNNSDSKK